MTELLVSMQVHDVQVADMASYLCLAENRAGTAEKLFSLTVQGEEGAGLSHHRIHTLQTCLPYSTMKF